MANIDGHEWELASKRKYPTTTKYTIKQLETSANKFVKIMDIDFDRLSKHLVKIYKLKNAEDWNGLHKEQMNACRTVQQISINIREIEKVRNKVKDKDMKQFDIKVRLVFSQSLTSMEQLLTSTGLASNLSPRSPATDVFDQHPVPFVNVENSQIMKTLNPRLNHRSYSQSIESKTGNVCDRQFVAAQTPFGSLPVSVSEDTTPLLIHYYHVIPPDCEASTSWEQLQENIIELNDEVHTFATKLEHAEDITMNFEESAENITKDVKEEQTVKVTSYKAALFPVVGAVVGGVVGGPIGLVAGLKIGSIAGAVGGAVGFASATLVKAHQEKASVIEMKTMSVKHAASISSLPDAKTEDKQVLNENERTNQAAESKENASPEVVNVFEVVTTSFKKFFSFPE